MVGETGRNRGLMECLRMLGPVAQGGNVRSTVRYNPSMIRVRRVVPALLVLAAWLLCSGGCGPLTLTIGGAADDPLTSTVVESEGGFRPQRVAVIDVSGMLFNARRREILSIGENPAGLLYEKLEKARTDKRVKAVLLRLNTPGGTVTASDTMYRQLLRFKQRSGKPIVALMMDVAASGGYYLACAADRIVAHPTTVTGSIGVIVQTISFKPALGRIGIEAEAITSGRNKDAGSPLSKLTDEHRQVLRSLVDDFYQGFLDVVLRARPDIPADQFAQVTDGRILSGEAAHSAGLVDSVGDLHDAFKLAKQLAGIDQADLVMYHRPAHAVRSPHAAVPGPIPHVTQINLAQINLDQSFPGVSAGFFYLWRMDAAGGAGR